MTYKWADGHNNEASLAELDPQPASPDGVRYPDTRWAANGAAVPHGFAFVELVWNSLTRDQYNSILTAFGLSASTYSNDGTARIRLNDDTFANRNATAVYIQDAQRKIAFWRNLTIRLNKLEAIS